MVLTCTVRISSVGIESELKADLVVRGQSSSKPIGREHLVTESWNVPVVNMDDILVTTKLVKCT